MHLEDFSSPDIGNELAVQSDLRLVTGLRAGSDAAFEELQRLYARKLYRTIFSITKNHEDTEDVLQETLIRAFLALDTFEGRSKVHSWLTRIAINCSLMALRKRRVRCGATFGPFPSAEDDDQYLQIKDPGPNPEEICLRHERRLRVIHAVTTLKQPLRGVIEFQIREECSLKEIARLLDVSVATVKSRLHRARRQLTEKVRNRR